MLKKNHRSGREQSRGQNRKATTNHEITKLLKRANALKAQNQHRDSINLRIRATDIMIRKLNAGIATQKARHLSTSMAKKELTEKKEVLKSLKAQLGKLK